MTDEQIDELAEAAKPYVDALMSALAVQTAESWQRPAVLLYAFPRFVVEAVERVVGLVREELNPEAADDFRALACDFLMAAVATLGRSVGRSVLRVPIPAEDAPKVTVQ